MQVINRGNNGHDKKIKNKLEFWIKFFKALKIIAFVGFILALVMTVVAIFVEILSATIIKFAVATVILIFLVSQFLILCLFDKKPKEKNPYPKQISTDVETKEDQNKLHTNKSISESNINQIGEQENNNLSSIEDNINK